jgi:hypothetical protein
LKNQKIIKICEEKFIYLNYSTRTRENYLSHINRFLQSLGEKQIIHCNSAIYHKISVFYGFNNGIPAEEISKIGNLCITKRTNNSKKSSNNFLFIE